MNGVRKKYPIVPISEFCFRLPHKICREGQLKQFFLSRLRPLRGAQSSTHKYPYDGRLNEKVNVRFGRPQTQTLPVSLHDDSPLYQAFDLAGSVAFDSKRSPALSGPHVYVVGVEWERSVNGRHPI
jgi:hypothetical protein